MREEWMTDCFCAKRWQVLAEVACLVIVLATLPIRAGAQVATTTVQGTVYRADGSPATGTVIVSWPAFSTSANQSIAAGSTTAPIGEDGFVSLALAPNLGAYPAGSYYTAVYHLNDGTVSKEYWVAPAATTATISAIRAQLAPATVAVQPVGKSYVDSSIAAIEESYLPLTGGTMSGPLVLEGDPTGSSQAATKHYVDALASTEVPLAGGSMSGALNTPNGVNKHSHVRRLDSFQLLAIFERGLRERCAVEGNVEMGDGERCMTEFEAQVLADLSVLKNQMATLLGDGNSGRIAIIEGRVDQHEQSFQRAKGFAVATGAVFTLVQFVLQLLHRK
jgi:hypothetical protein